MMNKRGESHTEEDVKSIGTAILAIVALLLVIGGFIFLVTYFKPDFTMTTQPFSEDSRFSWLSYVFGNVPTYLVERGTNDLSAQVILIGIFFLILMTFTSILRSFSTFDGWTSFGVSFAVAIIAANLKVTVYILVVFTSLFVWLGSLAAFAGMLAAFVAFFAVNWGVKGLGQWIMRRRAFMKADQTAIASEAGGKKVAGAIKGIETVGDALAGK